MKILILFLSLLFYSCVSLSTPLQDPAPIAPPKGLIPSGLIHIGDGHFHPKRVIIADKHTRTLSIWENVNGIAQLVDYFAMDFGKKNGDKFKQNDHKTPEGIYFIQSKKEAHELDFNEYGIMAFTLDYPNYFDKKLNKTGYGIWLHSIPPKKTLTRGSRGCLVLRESNIHKVNKYIKLNKRTPLFIYDKVTYITPTQLNNKKHELLNWLNKWKANWQEKNIDAYMSNYSKEFRDKNRDYAGWKLYKNNINKSTQEIKVKLRKTVIYKYKNQLIIRFLQEYESQNTRDFGEKTLYIKLEGGAPKILSEVWNKQPREQLGNLNL